MVEIPVEVLYVAALSASFYLVHLADLRFAQRTRDGCVRVVHGPHGDEDPAKEISAVNLMRDLSEKKTYMHHELHILSRHLQDERRYSLQGRPDIRTACKPNVILVMRHSTVPRNTHRKHRRAARRAPFWRE